MVNVLLDCVKSFLVLVQVAGLASIRDASKEPRDIVVLISIVDPREQDDSVEVLVHVRGGVFDKHLHFVD